MKKVFIAGHNGLVGSALLRALRHVPEVRVITAKKDELNLLNQSEVFDYFCKIKWTKFSYVLQKLVVLKLTQNILQNLFMKTLSLPQMLFMLLLIQMFIGYFFGFLLYLPKRMCATHYRRLIIDWFS